MMNYLISGASGLYGIHLIEELAGCQDVNKIYGIDDFSRGYPSEEEFTAKPWGDKVQIIKGKFQDISLKDIQSFDIDVIIHLAGYNSRKESLYIPEDYFCNNEYGTFLFINKLLKTKKRPFFIYASTTEVYGTPSYSPIDENHPLETRNVYSVTKVAAEKHILTMGSLNNYPVTVLRFTSTFGENQNICGYTSVITSFIDRALRNEPLIIYGSGKQSRDFLYVKDAVSAIRQAVLAQKAVEGRVINIATGILTCITDLADKIKQLTGSSSELIQLPGEKGEPAVGQIDLQLARELMGWTPQYSLDKGLSRTICWFKGLRSL